MITVEVKSSAYCSNDPFHGGWCAKTADVARGVRRLVAEVARSAPRNGVAIIIRGET